MPDILGKQNPQESYTGKYQKHIDCSYGYKLVCAADRFSNPFKTYLGEYAIYNFINSMIEESKFYSDMKKTHSNKELVMTKEDHENFKNSTKCWICDNDFVDNDIKVLTGNYRGSAHRDCNINLKLNKKLLLCFTVYKTIIFILLCKN